MINDGIPINSRAASSNKEDVNGFGTSYFYFPEDKEYTNLNSLMHSQSIASSKGSFFE